MKPHSLSSPANQPRQEGRPQIKLVPTRRVPTSPSKNEQGVVQLRLDAITVEAGFQCRAGLDKATVDNYAERMRAGDTFPPMDVFEIEDQYQLVDGWHRHPAALKAGLTEFAVEIHHGTRNDALRYALQANATHGLPRSNRDKRRAVGIALERFPNDSDHAIADLCAVSHVLVGKVRGQLETVSSSGPRVGRDGKKRNLPQKVEGRGLKALLSLTSEASGKQAQSAHVTLSGAVVHESKPTKPTLAASTSPSFWDDWSNIEDSLNSALKKWPAERWRRELASQLCKFADLRC